ncbi:P-loop containing nucleoside triphosphate hydrolase protein [Gloeopeniophorella convolvens]|nr:P-loop containing nucleoside triphosphate hydrolase protein [Gloeopeniophorella convolvens]
MAAASFATFFANPRLTTHTTISSNASANSLMAQIPSLPQQPAIARAPSSSTLPNNSAMLVICPTKSLEEDLLKSTSKYNVKAVAINMDTLDQARKEKRDLWELARRDADLVFLAPEQLNSRGLWQALQDAEFWNRIVCVSVDEAHLMNTWGKKFQKAYDEIGLTRARLKSACVILAVTATMQSGGPFKSVCHSLGLAGQDLHIIRRSNARPNVKLCIRDMKSGINGRSFPELRWVLTANRNILIYCPTIRISFHLMTYLWHQMDCAHGERAKRLRMYNALNWPSYNQETLELVHSVDGTTSQITVATDALLVGFDARKIADVVIVGEPETVDDVRQKEGRANRDGSIKDARALLYVTLATRTKASKVIEQAESEGRSGVGVGRKAAGITTVGSASTTEFSVAKLLTASCLTASMDDIYHNPPSTLPCSCASRADRPLPSQPSACNCSQCIPEDIPPPRPAPRRPRDHPSIALGFMCHPTTKLSESARSQATTRLEDFRVKIANAEHVSGAYHMIPSYVFLPDVALRRLVDNLEAAMDSQQAMDSVIQEFTILKQHGDAL